MSKKKSQPPSIRSSAAEYLSFVAASGEGGVEAIYADENVWLSQKMMGELYGVETHTINYHLKQVFSDSELQEDSVIRKFRITAADGKSYDTRHYNLSAIISVGYKVNSERAIQFRKWATGIIKEFTIKAFVMDDERLKHDGSILGKRYFEEQLQRIREIRSSERKFYQKITDIYATAIDYDVSAQATKLIVPLGGSLPGCMGERQTQIATSPLAPTVLRASDRTSAAPTVHPAESSATPSRSWNHQTHGKGTVA